MTRVSAPPPVDAPTAPAPRWPRPAVIAAGAAVALAAGGVALATTGSVLTAAGALLAGTLAAALAWFVTTLPGLTWRGVVTGGFFVVAGALSWTFINVGGGAVWAVLTVEGVLFAVWSYPWVRHLPALARLGTAWLGLSYWLLGVIGAALVGHPTVTGQRVLYAGVFTLAGLAVLATIRRTGTDVSVGIAGAFLLMIAALVLSGSANLFAGTHVVPDNLWGKNMEYRFWGGQWLLYHPNSLALLGVVVAVRIGADRAFAVWQRLTLTVLAGLVLLATNSRTGFVYLAAAAVVHAYLLWRRQGTGLPAYRRSWVAAAVPFAVLVAVLVLSGGRGFLFQSRYSGDDPTSGRLDTWKQVGVEWQHAGWAEKLFGDAKTARAVVHRANDGATSDKDRLNLTTDNAAVGALRRGGVLGVLAFLLGLGLLLWHAVPRPVWPRAPGVAGNRGGPAPQAWFTIAAVGALPTIATSDWLLGGTGGTLWILLLAGEAWLRSRPGPAGAPPAPAELTA